MSEPQNWRESWSTYLGSIAAAGFPVDGVRELAELSSVMPQAGVVDGTWAVYWYGESRDACMEVLVQKDGSIEWACWRHSNHEGDAGEAIDDTAREWLVRVAA